MGSDKVYSDPSFLFVTSISSSVLCLFAWVHGLDYEGLEVNMLSSDRKENSSGDYDLINPFCKQFTLKVFLIQKLINKHIVTESKRERTPC